MSSWNIFLTTLKKSFKRKLKIIAIVHTLYTNTYDTLYYEAEKDNNIDFKFVIIPFKQGSTNISITKIKEMMDRKNYPYILGYNEKTNKYVDIINLKPDAVFLQTPYEGQRISPLYSANYLSNFTKVFHISYGSTILDYNKGKYKNFLTNKLVHYDGVFIESSYLKQELKKYNPGKYIPVGYMKCDKFLHYSNKESQKNNKFTIAWKPRWVSELKSSNLLKYFNFFIELCKENPNFELIYINHPLCKQQLIENNILSNKEVEGMFNLLNDAANITVVENDDFLDKVFEADIFVGDYCSTIMEFALTKKPIIYTPVDDIVLSNYGNKILSSWYTANSKKELKKHIIRLKNQNDPKRKIREDLLYLLSDSPKNKSIALDILEYLRNNIKPGEKRKSTKTHNIYYIFGIIKIKIKKKNN